MSTSNIEDVYTLSPMQQGMLFHSIDTSEGERYYERFSCTLQGNIDATLLQQAWQAAIERHAVLRTAFSWERSDKPMQVVLRRVALPWEERDWKNLSSDEQDSAFAAFLQADRSRGFDVTQAPLMRLALFHLADDVCRFVWSFHHILKDGWSTGLVLKEVFSDYQSLCCGQSTSITPPRPFREYITWLQGQDLSRAKEFWQQTLKGVNKPTPFVVDRCATSSDSTGTAYAVQDMPLSLDLTKDLQALAKQRQLTLNTVLQGAWALLLHCYSDETDIVFGTPVSGRPIDLAGVEKMVGVFINTLPVRVQITPQQPFLAYLKDLQTHHIELRQYEYLPLVQIQGCSDVPRGNPLFESLMVFENVPFDASLLMPGNDISLSEVELVQQTHYPFNLFAWVLDNRMHLRVTYDRQRFAPTTVKQILAHLEQLLTHFVQQPDATLEQVKAVIPRQKLDVVVAATFTVEPLIEPLAFWMDRLTLPAKIQCAPYNQLFQQLLDPQSEISTNQQGINLLLIRLEDWVQIHTASPEEFAWRLEHNTNDFLDILKEASQHTSTHFLVCLCPPSTSVSSDPKKAHIIQHLEEQIAIRVASLANVALLHSTEILETYAVHDVNDSLADEEGHIPYTQLFFATLGASIVRKIFALRDSRYDAIVLDCDEALWQGASGTEANIQLLPPHIAFQERIVSHSDAERRLCLCSKSRESDVLAAFHSHPEMPLTLEHITSWRLNSEPTVIKLRSLADELRLPLESFIYISADSATCAEVQDGCPAVLVLQLPHDPTLVPQFIDHLWVFDDARHLEQQQMLHAAC